MSEINSIANGTFTIGSTSAINFQAGPGISVTEPTAGTVRIGNDETMLWSGDASTNTKAFSLSEKITNFERIRICGRIGTGPYVTELPTYFMTENYIRFASTVYMSEADGSPLQLYGVSYSSTNGLNFSGVRATTRWFSQNTTSSLKGNNDTFTNLYKIIGINRISGGNV